MLSALGHKQVMLQRGIAGGAQLLDEQFQTFAQASPLDEMSMHLAAMLRGLPNGLSETLLEDEHTLIGAKAAQAGAVGQGVGERAIQLRRMINQLIKGAISTGGPQDDVDNEIQKPAFTPNGSALAEPAASKLQSSKGIGEPGRSGKTVKISTITAEKDQKKGRKPKAALQQTARPPSSKTGASELARILSRHAGDLPRVPGATKPKQGKTAVEKISALRTPPSKGRDPLLAAQKRASRELAELAAKAEQQKPGGPKPKPAGAGANVLQDSIQQPKSIGFEPVVTLNQLLHKWFPETKAEAPLADVPENTGQSESSQSTLQTRVSAVLPESRKTTGAGQTAQVLPPSRNPLLQSLNQPVDKPSIDNRNQESAAQQISSTLMEMPSGKSVPEPSRLQSNVPDELATAVQWLAEEELEQTLVEILRREARQRGVDLP